MGAVPMFSWSTGKAIKFLTSDVPCFSQIYNKYTFFSHSLDISCWGRIFVCQAELLTDQYTKKKIYLWNNYFAGLNGPLWTRQLLQRVHNLQADRWQKYATQSFVLLCPHHFSIDPHCNHESIKIRICGFLQLKSVVQEHQRKHFPQIERI